MSDFFMWALVVTALILLSASAHARSTGQPRLQPINLVVIHSTGGPTCNAKTGQVMWVKSGTLAANIRFIEAHPKLGAWAAEGTSAARRPQRSIFYRLFVP